MPKGQEKQRFFILVNDEIANEFRAFVLRKFGPRRGALSRATEMAIKEYMRRHGGAQNEH